MPVIQPSPRIRLDQMLVDRGLVPSRSRARDAVARGTVTVAGTVATKPGQMVAGDAEIAVDDPVGAYVSRAALKLVAGLDAFGFDVRGLACLDVGASTGGFTQVLLERGAAHVTAMDVGHGQLHAQLRNDARVTVIEGLNARDLVAGHLERSPQVVVADVSFISLTLALPPALDLAAAGALGVFLVKPQFEVGRAAIGKGGIVRDEAAVAPAIERIRHLMVDHGWRVIAEVPSPIEGGDGNREIVLGAVKG